MNFFDTVRIDGEPPAQPTIYVSNHHGLCLLNSLSSAFLDKVKVIVKQVHSYHPVFSRIVKILKQNNRTIHIIPGESNFERILLEIKKTITEGYPVFVFPSGFSPHWIESATQVLLSTPIEVYPYIYWLHFRSSIFKYAIMVLGVSVTPFISHPGYPTLTISRQKLFRNAIHAELFSHTI